MGLVSIGEFARLSRLSPKALRLYDEMGLLLPTRVDPDSAYRWYEKAQLDRARLVALLRQIGVPLAQIKVILSLEPSRAAEEVAAYWDEAESDHAARRELVGILVDRLNGKRSVMYEVAAREIPERSLLCLKRHVSQQGIWALGKEFIGILKENSIPYMEGRTGAFFLIYHGEVNEDSDGPVEWCRPVPDDEASDLATRIPELSLRTEPAHREAFVHLGPATEIAQPQWPVIAETLHAWAVEQEVKPNDLGVRVTYLAPLPRSADSVPDCDFAVPFG